MKKIIIFLSLALIMILILAGCASVEAVTSPTSSTVSSPSKSPTNSPPPMTTWVPGGTPSPTVNPTATTALTLEEAQAQLAAKGWAAVDTAEKASGLTGYAVATPAFLPEGFIPRVWADSGIFMINKPGFGTTPARDDLPLEVNQYYSQNPDPKAPRGPYFVLIQSTAGSGMVGGVPGNITINGNPAQKSLVKATDSSVPDMLALYWGIGDIHCFMQGQLSSPLDEATLIEIAESMKVE